MSSRGHVVRVIEAVSLAETASSDKRALLLRSNVGNGPKQRFKSSCT